MEDLKIVIGKNLAALRKKKKLTQLELAEKMNYSDKAVSKWEQGATLPDIETLKSLCDFYGVTIDYLTHEENINKPELNNKKERIVFVNRIIITCLLATLVWMASVIAFVYPQLFLNQQHGNWLAFIWAVPATGVVISIMNRLYWKNKLVYIICFSIIIWSLLTSIYLHFCILREQNLWLLYLLGIPLQIAIILWGLMRRKK